MKRLLILALAVLVIAGCTGGRQTAETPPPPSSEARTEPPAPPVEKPAEPTFSEGPIRLLAAPASPVWGAPVAVVVENSPQARPQTGLQEADLVVETLAEAEISRFLALYWSAPAAKIGPVRSARTAFIAIADAYDAPFAHAGGGADALAVLALEWGARNLDEIYGSGEFFYRSEDREPPHNLYTSTELLTRAIDARRLAMTAPPTTDRAKSLPALGTTTRAVIDWHPLHQVSWEWQGDRYLRVDDGESHVLESGQQVCATNLVFLNVQGVNHGIERGWTLDMEAGGQATVLVAGHKWEGTWSLEQGGFLLTPADGTRAILLAPGTTWVHLITQESSFTLE